MRFADDRLIASIITSNSIKLSFDGAQVGCTMNTSLPRTFSITSTITSPSENRPITALPSGTPRFFATDCARSGFEFPVNTITLSNGTCVSARTILVGLVGVPVIIRRHLYIETTLLQDFQPSILVGVPGFEPGNAGIKIRCLAAWRHPNVWPTRNPLRAEQRVPIHSA